MLASWPGALQRSLCPRYNLRPCHTLIRIYQALFAGSRWAPPTSPPPNLFTKRSSDGLPQTCRWGRTTSTPSSSWKAAMQRRPILCARSSARRVCFRTGCCTLWSQAPTMPQGGDGLLSSGKAFDFKWASAPEFRDTGAKARDRIRSFPGALKRSSPHKCRGRHQNLKMYSPRVLHRLFPQPVKPCSFNTRFTRSLLVTAAEPIHVI